MNVLQGIGMVALFAIGIWLLVKYYVSITDD
jgi:hypothetical protein